MATTIRERMLALLTFRERDNEYLSFGDSSELCGEPIWRLAYDHRILFKTHPGFIEVTSDRDVSTPAVSTTFDVKLTSGVRVAVAPGLDAREPARLIATLESRC
jgi:hypothetical protein